jgi:sulfur-oxidizing protein SoxB
MDVTRRDFFTLIAIAGGLHASSPAALARALEPRELLEFQALGNVTLLHMTDPHGTLLPVYYREPDTKIGVGDETGKPPFLTGAAFLKAFGIARAPRRRTRSPMSTSRRWRPAMGAWAATRISRLS